MLEQPEAIANGRPSTPPLLDDNAEIVATVHARTAPMMTCTAPKTRRWAMWRSRIVSMWANDASIGRPLALTLPW
jgi:hypothetical protein